MAPEAGHPPAKRKGKSEEQSGRVPLWVLVLGVLALGGVVEVIIYGYLERPGWVEVSDKGFWDYLELLIVPATLAIGVYWLNRAQRQRELEAEAAHQARELQVEDRRAQDEALQAYLDGMSQLLTDKDRPLHRSPRGDRLCTVARARTLTVLSRLDGDRKARVVQFLYESVLIDRKHPIVDLTGADLSDANLRTFSLSDADLVFANLHRADLRGAILSSANLKGADLSWSNLSRVNLSGAWEWTTEQLEQAKSLEGATMPNGQKYEDWLKSKGSGEDGENGGS